MTRLTLKDAAQVVAQTATFAAWFAAAIVTAAAIYAGSNYLYPNGTTEAEMLSGLREAVSYAFATGIASIGYEKAKGPWSKTVTAISAVLMGMSTCLYGCYITSLGGTEAQYVVVLFFGGLALAIWGLYEIVSTAMRWDLKL